MRTWKRKHEQYWKIEITPDDLEEVKQNFDERKRGIDLAVDENHEPNHRALWRIRQLYVAWDWLFAKIQLEQEGASLLSKWMYKYFSPEIIWHKKDEETGEINKNLLVWWAFTNRPFFKKMEGALYSEALWDDKDTKFFIFWDDPMNFPEMVKNLIKDGQIDKETHANVMEAFGEEQSDLRNDFVAKFWETMATEEDESSEDQKEDEKETETEEKKEDQEEKKEDTWSEKTEEKGEFSDKEWSVSFAEFAEMKEKIKKFEFAEKKANIEKSLSSFVFSESNLDWVVLPKSMTKLIDFAVSLDEKQLWQFSEILSGVKQIDPEMFAEKGKDKTKNKFENMSDDEKLDAMAEEIVAKEKMSYTDAVKKARNMM